jgi:hypothetical protein
MLSDLRASAAGALEKAKTAISNRQLGIVDDEQQQSTSSFHNNIDDEDDYMNTIHNDNIANNNTASAVGNRSSVVFNELRTSSTKALEKAKLMFSSSRNNSMDNNNNDNNNTNDDDLESSPTKNLTAGVSGENEDISTSTTTSNVDRLEELAQYCPKLTLQQRIIGFFTSFGIGCKCLFTYISSFNFW